LLSGNGVVASEEWKTVPDIWRSSAEKYGDKIALVDPYHDPPSTMTYKQVYFFFLVISSFRSRRSRHVRRPIKALVRRIDWIGDITYVR